MIPLRNQACGCIDARKEYEANKSCIRLLLRVEIAIIRKALQNLVVTGWLKIGQHPLHDEVYNRRCVPDIKVKRDKFLPQAKFWLVIERGRIPPFTFIGDRPVHDIPESDVIKVEVEGDIVIEAKILPSWIVQ